MHLRRFGAPDLAPQPKCLRCPLSSDAGFRPSDLCFAFSVEETLRCGSLTRFRAGKVSARDRGSRAGACRSARTRRPNKCACEGPTNNQRTIFGIQTKAAQEISKIALSPFANLFPGLEANFRSNRTDKQMSDRRDRRPNSRILRTRSECSISTSLIFLARSIIVL